MTSSPSSQPAAGPSSSWLTSSSRMGGPECRGRRMLGRGAFGVVCAATKRRRVYKVQRKCATWDMYCPRDRQNELRFFREVARDHPNQFMRLFREYTRKEDDAYVLVLERMRGIFGESIAFFESRPLAVYSFLLQFFTALNVMRSKGYAHNDLHQGNVAWTSTDAKTIEVAPFFSPSSPRMRVPTFGRVWKLIDFGLVEKFAQGAPRRAMRDERRVFPRFLFAYENKEAASATPERRPRPRQLDLTVRNSTPRSVDIAAARALYPDQVSFAEKYAPLDAPQVEGILPWTSPLSSFALVFIVLFGKEAYVRALFLVPPNARSLGKDAQAFLESLPLDESRTLVSREEMLFLLQAAGSGAMDSVLVPHVLRKIRGRRQSRSQ